MDKLRGIFGVGLYLLLIGLVYEVVTILTRRWVSYPFTLDIKLQIGLSGLCMLSSVAMVISFNISLKLVKVYFKGGENKLITQGPYNFVRHPLYATLTLTLPPLFIIWYQDFIFIVPWVLIIISAHYLISVEERALIKVFGDDYKRYQRYVPMLVPYKGAGGIKYRRDPKTIRSEENSKNKEIKEDSDAL
ncbi:MAG: isoprenylcysteine carboxylmethyltransferase family protein [Chloroflexota bacterium]